MTKILVIEDEANIREGIVGILEFANYEVETANNGLLGIQATHKFEPDLILCDIMMPELNGYEVFLELSESPATTRIPFVFLTAMSAKDDIRKGMSLGADDYLTKPFSAEELLETIKTRLDRHQQIEKYNLEQMDLIKRYINLTLPHELRTPLNVILGYSEMLSNGVGEMNADKIQSLVDKLKGGALRLGNLIENYIAYSQAQMVQNDPDIRKKLQESSTLSDLVSLVRLTADKEAYSAGRTGDLQINIEPASIHIHYDHCAKLLSTIINNAFKFSSKGTRVVINGVVHDNNYVLAISNQGRGMTWEQIMGIKAFTQFERSTYEQQGLGLGLAIAQVIVDIYDGKLNIESEQGKNLTVFVTLPLS